MMWIDDEDKKDQVRSFTVVQVRDNGCHGGGEKQIHIRHILEIEEIGLDGESKVSSNGKGIKNDFLTTIYHPSEWLK